MNQTTMNQPINSSATTSHVHMDEWAETVSRVLWRKVIWPGLGLQFLLFGLVCLVAQPMLAGRCWAAMLANDDVTGAAPDAGMPPAPSIAELVATPLTTTDGARRRGQEADQSVDKEPYAKAAEVASENELAAPALNDETHPDETSASATGSSTSSQPDERADARLDAVLAEAHELSVRPKAQMLLPENRPAWIGAAPDLSTSQHRLFVGSFPMATPDEAEGALDEPLVAAVRSYLDETLFNDYKAYKLHVSADFIRKNMLDTSTEFMAQLSTREGPMYQKWVVLEITPEHRKHFVEELRQVQQVERMKVLGVGLLGILGVTGLANVAFNRRRRRYPSSLPPATYTLLPQDEPAGLNKKKRRAAGWLIAGCVLLALWLAGGLTVIRGVRSQGATVIYEDSHGLNEPHEFFERHTMADMEPRFERPHRRHRARIVTGNESNIVEVTSDDD